MTVYADLAFLLGATLFLGVYLLTVRLLDLRLVWWKATVFALVQGFLASLSLIPQIPAIIFVIAGIFTVAWSFRGKTVFGAIRNASAFLLVLLSYLAVALFFSFFFRTVTLVFDSGGWYFMQSFGATEVSFISAYGVGCAVIRAVKRRISRNGLFDCVFIMEGFSIPFRAYGDTGNFLSDPVSGLPVAVMEFELLKKAFGNDLPPPMTYGFSVRFEHRIRVVAYHTVSGNGRMMSALIPDRFFVNGRECKVLVAVSDRRLESQGRFSGIIGPELMGGYRDESEANH